MGLNNEKWQNYLVEARKRAAVGDDQFNATPEMDNEDIEYLRQKQREEQKRQLMTMMGGFSQ
jgi:hypothetical protein